MTLRLSLPLALAMAVAAVPAMAAASSAQADPAALAAARDLMKASDIVGQMKALGPSMATAAEQQMRNMFTDSKMPDGLQSQVSAAVKAYLGSMDAVFTPELIDEMANVYARHYSADELRHVAALMGDPVMVRFRQTTPALMTDLMPAMMKAMQPRQRAFQAQIMTIVRDWITQHPDDKAKLRSPQNS
ncbi:MAG TPA: DUF2059 domain-containing protein [Sphingobium sp.]